MNLCCRFIVTASFFILVLSGCVHYPVNKRLEQCNPDYGYRGRNMRPAERQSKDTLLMLTFSGGGTRAAAFSYGVLESLRDTELNQAGKKIRLLDEVDVISGVSGGSFTAAYYGLFGDRIFDDFETKFLKKNIQGALTRRILLRPDNWVRLSSPYFARSDLASEYYNKHIFEGATFEDMLKMQGPMIFINATDMVHGTRVAFTQDAFDLICSDLSTFPVSRACAASSAVPILLTPITLKNYADTCNFEMPEPLKKALEARTLPDRQFDLANNLLPFLDSKKKPYIHLVDGGVADNLGLRAILERIIAMGDAWTTLKFARLENIHKVVIVVVNAETEVNTKWDRFGLDLPISAMLESYSSISITKYNTETVALLRESFHKWAEEIRRGRCPPGQISKEPGGCGDIEFYLVEVRFDALPDEAERSYFKHLPTSFRLKPDDVDKLREVARRILTNSKEFQRLLNDLQ
ncbi:MAG: patatin-like phospholipase family protein [Candidatus Brocadiaceae bacterium]